MIKWPKKVRHRNKVLAKIYRPCEGRGSYRVAWHVSGKRMMKSFPTYGGKGGALEYAEELVKDLAKGSQVTALTPGQADDALAALERLQAFYRATGREMTLRGVVAEQCEALEKLHGRTVTEAVDGFLTTVATISRKPLAEAVAEFIESRRHLAESIDGKRPKRSPVYTYNVAMWLGEFANTFLNHAVCDMTKEHLNTYIANFKELSAKSRNDRRAVVKMFLGWCVQKDYLAPNHRLFEAVDFKTEDLEAVEIDWYRPKELRDMLTTADAELVPVIALGGLAGLRREEILRLDRADLWRVKGKVEISARIAKGRKRRLVAICPALAAWLRPYRNMAGPVWGKSPDALEEALTALRDTLGIPARRNGLRHSYVTFHMAMYCNENLTAAEAGNSPQMIHDHYRQLATKPEAKKWFGVKPTKDVKIIPLPAVSHKEAH